MKHTRLGSVGHTAIDLMEVAEKRVYRASKAPLVSVILALSVLSIMALLCTVIIAVSVDRGSVTVDMKAGVKLPTISNVREVVENVAVTNPSTSTTQTPVTSTTSSTSTTVKRVYGVFHDGTPYWFDPNTGVGSAPSGNDPGACGR